jgi:hypothetical protein
LLPLPDGEGLDVDTLDVDLLDAGLLEDAFDGAVLDGPPEPEPPIMPPPGLFEVLVEVIPPPRMRFIFFVFCLLAMT